MDRKSSTGEEVRRPLVSYTYDINAIRKFSACPQDTPGRICHQALTLTDKSLGLLCADAVRTQAQPWTAASLRFRQVWEFIHGQQKQQSVRDSPRECNPGCRAWPCLRRSNGHQGGVAAGIPSNSSAFDMHLCLQSSGVKLPQHGCSSLPYMLALSHKTLDHHF